MKALRSAERRLHREKPSPERSKKSVTLFTWRTDRDLRVVGVTNLSPKPVTFLPSTGEAITRRGPLADLFRYSAHLHALEGKPTTHRFVLHRRVYEARLEPRRDRRRRIVGVRGIMLLLGVSGGRKKTDLPPSPTSLTSAQRTRISAIQSLELARTVSDTARIHAEIRNGRLQAAHQQAVQAQMRAELGERRARFLAEASAVLDSSFEQAGLYDRIGKLAVDRFCDWFVLQMRENARLCRISLHQRDPDLSPLLEKMFPKEMALGPAGLFPRTPDGIHPEIPDAGIFGSPSRRSDEVFGLVTDQLYSSFVPMAGMKAARELNVQSVIRTPMMSHGRLIGYLTFGVMNDSRAFDLQDFGTAKDLSGRIAVAHENSLLYEEAQREIAMRREIEARMRVLNSELETRVLDRTRLLEEATREANSFAYTVAHDLRAPLRAITGFCQALKEDYSAAVDAQGRDYLERIVTGARKMDDLIRDLLDYARINRADIQRNVLDLDEVIDEVLHLMSSELQERAAAIEVAKPLGKVIAHGPVLVQVLTNLISNAAKFVAPGVQPRVEIRAEKRRRIHSILIQDNGIGIDPQHQERIFGIFERLNRAEEYPGTGIGLAIVRRAIERFGGSVGVESAPGLGSTFRVELPSA